LHHFSFAHPEFLVGLVLVPIFLAFALIVRRRRSRYTVAFTNLETLQGVGRRRRTAWRWLVPLLLLSLSLTAAVAALARPRIQVVGTQGGATIILLADVSGSMAATDVRPARIYAAVNAMKDLVSRLPSTAKVGLVTFSDSVQILSVPTTDHNAINQRLELLSPQGGTNLGAGVEAAVKLAASSLADSGIRRHSGQQLPAAIVLESDGAQDRGTITPFAAGRFAGNAGIRIFGVALGTRHGFIPQTSGLLTRSVRVLPAPGTVALLARESNGEAFDAASANALYSIYNQLGSSLARHRENDEITGWFELAAGVFLVAGIAAARLRGAPLP
jgi:Ca-activated chloride channel homolog